jgi:hypothetical protein
MNKTGDTLAKYTAMYARVSPVSFHGFFVVLSIFWGYNKQKGGFMLAKKFALGFGIAIILPMMVHYGVSTFSPAPKWQDRYDAYSYQRYDKATPEQRAQMDKERKEEDRIWRQKEKVFQSRLFGVAVPVGIISIIIGANLSIQAIGTGLMFGGIFSLTEGYMMYWSELQDWMRFVSLIVAFIVLIYVGYRKLAK